MESKNGSLADIPDDIWLIYLKCSVSSRRKQKAQAFVSACYVEKLNITLEDGNIVRLRGEIYPSVKKSDSRHVVDMDINVKEKCVTDAFCRCKQGNSGTCSHMLAVLYLLEQWKIAGYMEVPALLSSTSLSQLWDKPRGPRFRKVQVTNDQIACLKSLTASPISYLTEETTPDTLHVETPIGQQVIGSALSYHVNLMGSVYEPREELGCGDIQLPRDINLDPDTEQ